jgi:hypothetical protein
MEGLTNSLISFMKMNGKRSQLKENSTKTSVLLSKDHSSLYLNYLKTDTLISSTTETW